MRTDVVAIMFTDLVGYTERTSAQSHAENAEMLKRLGVVVPPLVRSFGGRVVKEMGDGILSCFDAPTAAVESAMAIQDRLAELNEDLEEADRMRLRVAINVGEVRFERGDVFGEAVNIAARIESQTPAEHIYVSESTVLTMNRVGIPVEQVGPMDLKGIAEPVMIYEIPAEAPLQEADDSEMRERENTLPYFGRQLAELRQHIRRRRIKIAAVVLAVTGAVAVGGHQTYSHLRTGAEVAEMRAALAGQRFVEAASRLAVLREKGVEVEADVERLLSKLRGVDDAASACMAADRLSFLATHRDVLMRLRLTHAFTLIDAGELAQAGTCLADLQLDERDADARILELSQIHLEALESLRHHKGLALRDSLKKYEAFLRAGAAPAKHMKLIARIAAEGYLHKATRPVADSLVVESLGTEALGALHDRALQQDTPPMARAWIMARLRNIDEDSRVDWRAAWTTVLGAESNSTCTMRREAIEGLRGMGLLRDAGLIARELNRNDRCTRTTAREALSQLVREGKIEIEPNSMDALFVASR